MRKKILIACIYNGKRHVLNPAQWNKLIKKVSGKSISANCMRDRYNLKEKKNLSNRQILGIEEVYWRHIPPTVTPMLNAKEAVVARLLNRRLAPAVN